MNSNQYVDLLTYMACDHLLASLYLVLYCMEEQSLNNKNIDELNYKHIQEAVCLLNSIVYSILNEENYNINRIKLKNTLKRLKQMPFVILRIL